MTGPIKTYAWRFHYMMFWPTWKVEYYVFLAWRTSRFAPHLPSAGPACSLGWFVNVTIIVITIVIIILLHRRITIMNIVTQRMCSETGSGSSEEEKPIFQPLTRDSLAQIQVIFTTKTILTTIIILTAIIILTTMITFTTMIICTTKIILTTMIAFTTMIIWTKAIIVTVDSPPQARIDGDKAKKKELARKRAEGEVSLKTMSVYIFLNNLMTMSSKMSLTVLGNRGSASLPCEMERRKNGGSLTSSQMDCDLLAICQ